MSGQNYDVVRDRVSANVDKAVIHGNRLFEGVGAKLRAEKMSGRDMSLARLSAMKVFDAYLSRKLTEGMLRYTDIEVVFARMVENPPPARVCAEVDSAVVRGNRLFEAVRSRMRAKRLSGRDIWMTRLLAMKVFERYLSRKIDGGALRYTDLGAVFSRMRQPAATA